MSDYVTRAELREELDQRFAPYGNLETFGIALIDRIERGEQRLIDRMDQMDGRMERMEHRMEEIGQRLLDELARHVQAANEEMRTHISALDDKYSSLPARVERLEAKRRRR